VTKQHTWQLGCTTATFGGKLPTKLKAIKEAGFVSTEFWPRDLFEHAEGPEIAIDLLRQTGLGVSAYQALRNFEGSRESVMPLKLEIARQMMDQMALVGARTLVLCSNTDPGSSGDRSVCAAHLRQLGELAASRGLRVAYETLSWGHWINDYRDAWSLIQDVAHPSVGLLLDSFHLFVRQTPLQEIERIGAEHIFLVELADLVHANMSPIETSRSYRLFPGEGVGPIAQFLDRVAQTGYDGVLSLEIFNAHHAAQDPGDVARRAMDRLQAALR
jgi:4-hydroxyphenylpyruvate dioxygenase